MKGEHKSITIKPLSNKKAAELGAEMIAESMLTMIPVTFLIIALNRRLAEELKLDTMQSKINDVSEQYDDLRQLIVSMQSELNRLRIELEAIHKGMDSMDEMSLISNDIITSTEPILLQKQPLMIDGDTQTEKNTAISELDNALQPQ